MCSRAPGSACGSAADQRRAGRRTGSRTGSPHLAAAARIYVLRLTQGAISALLRGFGLRQGSLTHPLHVAQVQGLLLGRYRRLADLQFSCWLAPPGEQACSTCGKCFGIALFTIAEGISPREVGIDPVRALCSFADWHVDAAPGEPGPKLSEYRLARHHTVRALQRRSTEAVASILSGDASTRDDSRLGEALAIYARLHAEAAALTVPPAPGYVTDFLDLVPADLRHPLKAILAQHFPPTKEPEFAVMTKRARALTNWISEPLKPMPGWRSMLRVARGSGPGA